MVFEPDNYLEVAMIVMNLDKGLTGRNTDYIAEPLGDKNLQHIKQFIAEFLGSSL